MLSLFLSPGIPKSLESELPAHIRKVAKRTPQMPTDQIGVILITPDEIHMVASHYHGIIGTTELPRFVVLLTEGQGINARWCSCTLARFSGVVVTGCWDILRSILCPKQRTTPFVKLAAQGGLAAIPEMVHYVSLEDFSNLPAKDRTHLEQCSTCRGIFLEYAQALINEQLRSAMQALSQQFLHEQMTDQISPLMGRSPRRGQPGRA